MEESRILTDFPSMEEASTLSISKMESKSEESRDSWANKKINDENPGIPGQTRR